MAENQNIRDVFNGIPEDCIVLNAVNCSGNIFEKHSSVIKNRNNWHAFLIHNVTNPQRNVILKIVLDHVFPEALLPILFQSKGTDCIFLARNCSGAIETLLKNKLAIPDPIDSKVIYTCEIVLMYSTISKLPLPQNNISKILELLYDDKSETLNLKKFSDNKELSEYSPLSQPKLLCFALHLSCDMKPAFIQLNDNEIRTLSPFEVLRGIGSVQKLDLRNNLIEDLEELNYLKVFDLVELWLDGNPLCKKYDAFSYVKSIKEVLPMLEKLDGVSIGLQSLLMPQQNFLCSYAGFNLADQFVHHFFSLYDTSRNLLADVYHPRAIFSITTKDTQKIEGNDRLCPYKALSRNLLHSERSLKKVITGNAAILNKLCELPPTRHNTQTFSVDMIYYKECSAVISVTGTFYEDFKQKILPDTVFHFKRTFTLIKRNADYVIYNDLFHVNAMELLTGNSRCNQQVQVNLGFKDCDMKRMQEAMSNITGMNREWIKRFLEDANYNISEFLSNFISLFKSNQIPEQAFSQNNKQNLMDWLVPKMMIFGLENFENSLQKEALEYISKTTNSILKPTNMQKYGCLHLIGNKMNESNSFSNTESNLSNQSVDSSLPISEFSCQSSTTKFQIPHENCPKNNPIEMKDQVAMHPNQHEIQNKKRENVTYVSEASPSTLRKGDPTNKLLQLQQKRSNLVTINIDEKAENEMVQETIDLTECEEITINDMGPDTENIQDHEIQPTIALLDMKWIDIRNNKNYAFQLLFNKWTLAEKIGGGKLSSRHDDFQKNFTCWKKHFPTYPNENLAHTLHSSCLHPKLKSTFRTIRYPVTFWDFPASVPYNIRPPKFATIQNGGPKTSIYSGCGYGFLYVKKKWVLVTKSDFDQWVLLNNQKKVVWRGNGWVIEPFTLEEKANISATKVERQKITLKRKFVDSTTDNENPLKRRAIIEKDIKNPETERGTEKTKVDEVLIDVDGDIEVATEEVNEKLQLEEIKAIYTEDVGSELTITTTNLVLNFLQNTNDKNTTTQYKSKAEMLKKWKGLFEFVPYVPKIGLVEGYWTLMSEKSDLKFYKKLDNNWVLLEKDCGNGEWHEINDDFSLDKNASTEQLGNNVFDHIPMPVTMYDFPSSVPSKLTPPLKISIGGTHVEVTPDSEYAFVSVRGQWVAVKKNEQGWLAVNSANETAVKKKLANMPSKYLMTHKESVVLESELDKKISSVSCTLLQLLTGVKVVKPLTYWDIAGSEDKKPPRLALTDIDGEQRWCCVSKDCGKGFVLEDNVWVKVIPSKPDGWKATQYKNYPGCVLGYYLFNNVWITMKKHILGGKWSPVYDTNTTPSTYWHYIGSEESKPPQKITLGVNEKIIHSNSNMGFIEKEGAWVLMEKEDKHWRIAKHNQQFHIYKLINGIWRIIERNSKDEWYYKPVPPKIYTYQNFDGLQKYAPPKQVSLVRDGKTSCEIIDEKSGMGFQLIHGVWVLKKLKDGKLIPLNYHSKSFKNIGYKLIDGKFKVIRMDESGEWMDLVKDKIHNVKNQNVTIIDHIFKWDIPLTYDGILVDAPDTLKPPKYALIKDFVQKKIRWRLVDKYSGYGFVRENDTWLLMKWISGKHWKNTLDEVEYRYKIVNNYWTPVKNENNAWIPVCNTNTTLKVPDLCVHSPENALPNKIIMNKKDSTSKINITPTSGIGYMKTSDGYLLLRKMSSEKLVILENFDQAVVFKLNISGQWVMSTPQINSVLKNSPQTNSVLKNSPQTNSVLKNSPQTNSVLKNSPQTTEQAINTSISNPITYKDIADWPDEEKPPMDFLLLFHKEHKLGAKNCTCNFGFVKNGNVWVVAQKNGITISTFSAYKLIKNRWVSMELQTNNMWVPAFDPEKTPQTYLDTFTNNFEEKPPLRVVIHGDSKWMVITTNKLYGFIRDNDMWVIMTCNNGQWTECSSNGHKLGYKIVDGKWTRFTKHIRDDWKVCGRTTRLPVLACDFTPGNKNAPPYSLPLASITSKKVKDIDVGPLSDKGFVLDNGAWVLMEKHSNKWVKLDRFPQLKISLGYMLENDIWKYVSKDVDGSWKFGSFQSNKWLFEKKLTIPVKFPISEKEIEKLPLNERPPQAFVIHENSKPKMVFLSSIGNTYGFVLYKDAWLLLESENLKWKVAGGIVAYKLFGDRWVNMTLQNDLAGWTPSYDPVTTPITYFESTLPLDSRPPLRIQLNEDGKDTWKVIFQHSGYGFTRQDTMWVLMTKKCDATWEIHKDFSLESTGYKIVDFHWVRFKTKDGFHWKRKEPRLPMLLCDFSINVINPPPPSFSNIFLKEPRSGVRRNINIDLHSYSKFGFRREKKVWILMESNDSINWFEHKLYPYQKDLLGYKYIDSSWVLMKKLENGCWVEGKLQYSLAEGGRFVQTKLTSVKQVITSKSDQKLKGENDEEKSGGKEHKNKENINEKKVENVVEQTCPNEGVIVQEAKPNKPVIETRNELRVDNKNEEKTKSQTISVDNSQKSLSNVLVKVENRPEGQSKEQIKGDENIDRMNTFSSQKSINGNALTQQSEISNISEIKSRNGSEVDKSNEEIMRDHSLSVEKDRKAEDNSEYLVVEGQNEYKQKSIEQEKKDKNKQKLEDVSAGICTSGNSQEYKQSNNPGIESRDKTEVDNKNREKTNEKVSKEQEKEDFLRVKNIVAPNRGEAVLLESEISETACSGEHGVDNKNKGKTDDKKHSVEKDENTEVLEEFQNKNTEETINQKKADNNLERVQNVEAQSNRHGSGSAIAQASLESNKPQIESCDQSLIDNKNKGKTSDQGHNAEERQEQILVEERNKNGYDTKEQEKEDGNIQKSANVEHEVDNEETRNNHTNVDKNVHGMDAKNHVMASRNNNERETKDQKEIDEEKINVEMDEYENDCEQETEKSNENKENLENANEQTVENGQQAKDKMVEVPVKRGIKVGNQHEIAEQTIEVKTEEIAKDEIKQELNDGDIGTSINPREKIVVQNNAVKDNMEPKVQGQEKALKGDNVKMERTEKAIQETSVDVEMKCPKNKSGVITITSPVQYHQLAGLPDEKKPPKSVCLNIRGAPRRIPLVSKNSKIGFQYHDGVWVLLERLSGTWKILHNSAGLPLAYKLIDSRWVSMRFDKNGSWIPTFNPVTTPRTYFDVEGAENRKPPRRVVLEEDGHPRWIEIGEFSGLGFLESGEMWLLMKKSGSNWVAYKDNKEEEYAFKVQDFRWTKFTKGKEGCWKVAFDDLPVLHYDFSPDSQSAPPEVTTYLLKRFGRKIDNVGFLRETDAWVFMERDVNNTWSAVSCTKSTFGFTKSSSQLWNLVEKDEDGQWKSIESNVDFETAFNILFSPQVKREREIIDFESNKRIKMEPSSLATANQIDVMKTETDQIVTASIDQTIHTNTNSSNVTEHDHTEEKNTNLNSLTAAEDYNSSIAGCPNGPTTETTCENEYQQTNRKPDVNKSINENKELDSQVTRHECIEEKGKNVSSTTATENYNGQQTNRKPVVNTSMNEELGNIQRAEDEVNSTTVDKRGSPSLNEEQLKSVREHELSPICQTEDPRLPQNDKEPDPNNKKSEIAESNQKSEGNPSGNIEYNASSLKENEDEQNSRVNISSERTGNDSSSSKESEQVENEDPKMSQNEENLNSIIAETVSERQIEKVNSNQVEKEFLKMPHSDDATSGTAVEEQNRRTQNTSEISEYVSPSLNKNEQQEDKQSQNHPTKAEKIDVCPTAAAEVEEPHQTTKNDSVECTECDATSTNERSERLEEKGGEELNCISPKTTGEETNPNTPENTELGSSSTSMETFETKEDPNTTQNHEQLNSVEQYLALKPDCCLGCPELQTLLRQFRPANIPNKILRKSFKLPDGSTRMLSIPRALPVTQTKTEVEVTNVKSARKRASKDGVKSKAKRKKKL